MLAGVARQAAHLPYALVATLLFVATSCEQRAGEEQRPKGIHLVADGPALVRALTQAAILDGTPLGNASARAVTEIEACRRVVGSAPSGSAVDLLHALRCGEPEGELLPLAEPGGAHLALASGDGGPWTVFRANVDEKGGVRGELSFPRENRGMATLLVPDAAPAGDGVFAEDGAVVHGRFRVRGGIDLEKLKTEQKVTEKMKLPDFSGLLAGTLTDGTWELAVYAPAEGRTTPRIALALGVRSTRAAKVGMDSLLTELEESWQLSRSSFRVGGAEGACLLDLTVLPDLAPCWILQDGHIALGWNQDSLVRALSAGSGGRDDVKSRLRLDFAAMTAVDDQMTKATFGPESASELRYPWDALTLEGAGEGRLLLSLPARSDGP